MVYHRLQSSSRCRWKNSSDAAAAAAAEVYRRFKMYIVNISFTTE